MLEKIIESCDSLAGDFRAKSLRTLANICLRLPESPIIAEIGAWIGSSTCIIAKIAQLKDGKVYCIDHWEGSVGTAQVNIIDRGGNPYERFKENMKALELTDVVHTIKQPSVDASRLFNDDSLDMVFIDADHRYESVQADISVWWPKLKIDGLMVGHDAEFYYNQKPNRITEVDKDTFGGCHSGVIAALYDEFGDYHSLYPGEWIWWIKKGFIPCLIKR